MHADRLDMWREQRTRVVVRGVSTLIWLLEVVFAIRSSEEPVGVSLVRGRDEWAELDQSGASWIARQRGRGSSENTLPASSHIYRQRLVA